MTALKLTCSRGCEIDTTAPLTNFAHKRPGDRCNMVIAYDRMSGNTYCGRVLREVK